MENLIAFNLGGFNSAGVRVREIFDVADENRISRNQIYSNEGHAIDLGNDGTTFNDTGDEDEGENQLQNFPEITSATSNGEILTIEGTLNSTSGEAFSVEFFVSPNCETPENGEGQIFRGEMTANTDSSGNASFSHVVPGVPVGNFVTATATRNISADPPLGETSEFSECFQIEQPSNDFHCVLDGTFLFPPTIGTDVTVVGTVLDQNDAPVPGQPVNFFVEIFTGDNDLYRLCYRRRWQGGNTSV